MGERRQPNELEVRKPCLEHNICTHGEFDSVGSEDEDGPRGKIRHAGGILFINVANGKNIEVSRFTINLSRGNLTGIVNGNPKARVPLFNLDLSHAKLAAGKHIVTARGIGLKLTSVAAKALNAALGTKLFSAGLKLGTAGTLLRF